MAQWQEVDGQQAFNTAIAAQAFEQYPFSGSRYNRFNTLAVINSGSTDIKVLLDGLDAPGSVWIVPKNMTFFIDAEDGRFFRYIRQQNLDATNAEVAGNIEFRAGLSKRVG